MAVRTMIDYLAEQGGVDTMLERAVQEEAPADPLLNRLVDVGHAVPNFTCRCGRRAAADVMVDLDNPAVPPAHRVPSRVRGRVPPRAAAPEDARRFACDACWTHWIRTKVIDRDTFRRAIDAPAHRPGRNSPW